MNKTHLRSALTEYVSVLESSLDDTHQAEDRSRYRDHLAAAARMFIAIEKHDSINKLKQLVATEHRSYGWDYLAGDSGDRAESAFNQFANIVESIIE